MLKKLETELNPFSKTYRNLSLSSLSSFFLSFPSFILQGFVHPSLNLMADFEAFKLFFLILSFLVFVLFRQDMSGVWLYFMSASEPKLTAAADPDNCKCLKRMPQTTILPYGQLQAQAALS